MNSKTTIVATQFRLQEWAEQVRECQNRPAGMSVVAWCTGHGITKANYYYRLRRVREACLETISMGAKEDSPGQIVSVDSALLQQEKLTCGSPDQGLDISINDCSIHVTEMTSMELLSAVLEVVRGAE